MKTSMIHRIIDFKKKFDEKGLTQGHLPLTKTQLDDLNEESGAHHGILKAGDMLYGMAIIVVPGV